MENKRLIMLFGILFSVVFCLMYYVLFSFTLGKANDDKRTLYMNQVGLYEKAQSVQDMQEKLEKEGFLTRTFGGAVLNSASQKEHIHFYKRTSINQKEKAKIAQLFKEVLDQQQMPVRLSWKPFVY